MQRDEHTKRRKSDGQVLRKERNTSGEIRPDSGGRSDNSGKKWWDPIADVVFPHRVVRKKQELRRRNTMRPEMGGDHHRRGFPRHVVGPMGHSVHHGMYPGYMDPHNPVKYPPQPHPAGFPPPPPPSMYPFYGIPHPSTVPHLPPNMHPYPGYHPIPTPYNDTDGDGSVLDPSFYTNPSELGTSHVSSSHKARSKGGGKRPGRKSHKPPLVLQPPDPLAEEYNTAELGYESDKEKQDRKPSLDNDLIKGFDDFMLY